jgi:hypothetical protein
MFFIRHFNIAFYLIAYQNEEKSINAFISIDYVVTYSTLHFIDD